jgi:hypothetical protein
VKYKILIDRSSIKENPHAGNVITCFHGLPITTEEYEYGTFKDGFLVEYTIKEENIDILEKIRKINKKHIQELSSWSDEEKKILGKCLVIKRNDDVCEIRHPPESKYLYKYLPYDVECDTCYKKFDHTELMSDRIDYEWYTNTQCPYCGRWNCCEIEYEKIEDVI